MTPLVRWASPYGHTCREKVMFVIDTFQGMERKAMQNGFEGQGWWATLGQSNPKFSHLLKLHSCGCQATI